MRTVLCALCLWIPLPWRVMAAQNGRSVRSPLLAVLESVPDDKAAPSFTGLTNIFFEPLTGALRDSARTLAEWTDTQIADVIDAPALRRVRAIRYKMPADSGWRYRLDSAGTLDFTRAVQLELRPQEGLKIATIVLRFITHGGSSVTAPLQIIDAGKYTYARIAEARSGQLVISGRSYPVRVQPRSRNNPFYSVQGGTQFFIDLNRDGEFSKRASQLVNGKAVAAEEVQPGVPFWSEGASYEITSVDSAGRSLVVRVSTQRAAVAIGFRVPSFTSRDLTGMKVELSRLRGRPVLLEFWSTECPYSEAVRTPLNQLMREAQNKFGWISMARESSQEAVRQFLETKPRGSHVVLNDSTTWSRFNPNGVTPLFVVVDRNGKVAFVASGATGLAAVEAKLRELFGLAEP